MRFQDSTEFKPQQPFNKQCRADFGDGWINGLWSTTFAGVYMGWSLACYAVSCVGFQATNTKLETRFLYLWGVIVRDVWVKGMVMVGFCFNCPGESWSVLKSFGWLENERHSFWDEDRVRNLSRLGLFPEEFLLPRNIGTSNLGTPKRVVDSCDVSWTLSGLASRIELGNPTEWRLAGFSTFGLQKGLQRRLEN